MKLRLVKRSAVLSVSVGMLIAGSLGLACASRSPVAPDPIGKVIVVEQFELDSILAKYVVSESKGEITALATCAGAVGDDGCAAAAREQLREEATKRGVGLVVITQNLLRPTLPAQVSLRATLHQITPR